MLKSLQLPKVETSVFPVTQQLNDKSDIKVSIIIPTYNKYPLNLFTLYSLEKQNFNMNQMEVILVDDGSTDPTSSIPFQHQFPFLLKYIKCFNNIGRPKARNLGIKAASGEVIIFLDAEVIVKNDFVLNHFNSHMSRNNLVNIGVLVMKGLYSVLFPGYTQAQLNEVNKLTQDNPHYNKKINDFVSNKKITPLISQADIHNENYSMLSFVKPLEKFYERGIFNHFNDSFAGYRLPWIAFGTGNISVKRSFLEKVGLLFEEYDGYGWDDIEMGYRLYKSGAVFQNGRNIVTYHQEHPISTSNQIDANNNYCRFIEKHNDIDAMGITLSFTPRPTNYHKINAILNEYHQLGTSHPQQYKLFKKVYREMLKKIAYKRKNNEPIARLIDGLITPNENRMLALQKMHLAKLRVFHNLLQSFQELERF
ncbi:glycosyl transferase family 2 [Scopulibacillus darangshiensis]|uniref:Glycosyl transferase family 2 n=1 Tax=Scopulibacillus darangshiensis TaxID=442528 RepID=A0A4R2NQW5_9BACL|nr:glycosyltransferase family 2 protein [Scopulibacillus darangshiensis]TCP23794.1 glycosyl transferase family 2 [Scopulibacillus darangshiensis]